MGIGIPKDFLVGNVFKRYKRVEIGLSWESSMMWILSCEKEEEQKQIWTGKSPECNVDLEIPQGIQGGDPKQRFPTR